MAEFRLGDSTAHQGAWLLDNKAGSKEGFLTPSFWGDPAQEYLDLIRESCYKLWAPEA